MRLTSRNTHRPMSPEYGDQAEMYQTSTRNLGFTKRYSKAHETHYDPRIQQLVADAPLHLQTPQRVPLPAHDQRLLSMPLGEAIGRRRSGRSYADAPVTGTQLSTLLYNAVGVRPPHLTATPALSRNVTNSGNLGSVEAYPIVMSVDGVEPGIYHYDTVTHDLAQLTVGHFGHWLREIVFFQVEFADAAVAVILTSAVGRLKSKYGPRGYRFGLLDTGHVSANIYLTGTALGLQVCATAGFVDEAIHSALNVDGLDTCATLTLLVGSSWAAHTDIPTPRVDVVTINE